MAAPAGGTHIAEELGQVSSGDEDAPGDDATIEEIQDYFLTRQQVGSSQLCLSKLESGTTSGCCDVAAA